MATEKRRSALSYIPGFYTNAVLQVILASGVAFVMLGICWAIIQIMYSGGDPHFNDYFRANIGLPALANFKDHWWTPLIYGWFHFNGFMELLSNMLWLYCFGSVVQMLVGYKQIIPLYAYSLTIGGIVYLLAQMIPGIHPPSFAALGSRAGLMAMAAAAVTLTPQYRFYLTEHFSVPLLVVAGVFAALMLIGSFSYIPTLALVVAGGLSGFGYIKLLQAGYRPGDWMYTLSQKIAGTVTPNEDALRAKRNNSRKDDRYGNTSRITQSRVDAILDKINQKGVNSLTAEEKEILAKASKE